MAKLMEQDCTRTKRKSLLSKANGKIQLLRKETYFFRIIKISPRLLWKTFNWVMRSSSMWMEEDIVEG